LFKELPLWDNKLVTEDIYFRAFSNELEEDIIKYKGADLSVEHEYTQKKIAFDWLPEVRLFNY
jgi:hypothetical protein